MDNNEKIEKRKRQIQASGIKKQTSSVELRCKGCGKMESITTTNILAYTIEVRNNYFCWKCKPPKSKVVIPKKQIDQKKPTNPVTQELLNKGKDVIKDFDTSQEVYVIPKFKIRADGVLRIGARFIEDYGFKGGDFCIVSFSKNNIIVTKTPETTKEMV